MPDDYWHSVPPLPPADYYVRSPSIRRLWLALAGLKNANPGNPWPARLFAAFESFLRSDTYRSAPNSALVPFYKAFLAGFDLANYHADHKSSTRPQISALTLAAEDAVATMDDFEAVLKRAYVAAKSELAKGLDALVLPLGLAAVLVYLLRRR